MELAVTHDRIFIILHNSLSSSVVRAILGFRVGIRLVSSRFQSLFVPVYAKFELLVVSATVRE